MPGARWPLPCALGTVPAPASPFGFHWFAPAGRFVSSQSYLNKFSKNWLLHFVGVSVHVISRPLVIVSPLWPTPCVLAQPKPWWTMSAASGSQTTCFTGSHAPWVLPTV